MPFVGGPHTQYKSKIADGRHLGKIEKLLYYLSRDLSDFDEIWHVKNLKNQKSPYLGRGSTDFHEIWNGDAFRTS